MKITTYEVKAPVSRAFTAALVADMHDKPHEAVLAAVADRKADVIFNTGDIIDGHGSRAERADRFLADCAAVAPTFMSWGNHEAGAIDFVREAAANAGVVILENSYTQIYGIKVGGLISGFIEQNKKQGLDKRTPPPNTGWLAEFASLDGYKVLLNHHPEYYPKYVKPLNIDLTLSGHAHGGQWRIFGRGFFAPGQGFFPKYTEGFTDGRLIVSRGLANNAPAPRFFNPRELVFIEFSPSDN